MCMMCMKHRVSLFVVRRLLYESGGRIGLLGLQETGTTGGQHYEIRLGRRIRPAITFQLTPTKLTRSAMVSRERSQERCGLRAASAAGGGGLTQCRLVLGVLGALGNT